MIFVTVGTQLPFDRLVQAVALWASTHDSVRVVAQVGQSDFKSEHVDVVRELGPQEYQEFIERADHVIAHAGTGSIISAREAGRPVLIVPRDPTLGEVRSEHQSHTAAAYEGVPGVLVARDVDHAIELIPALIRMKLGRGAELSPETRQLHSALAAVVDHARRRSSAGGARRVVCACSTGGHFSEMQRLIPALHGHDVLLVTSRMEDAGFLAQYRHFGVREASRWSRTKGIVTFLQMLWILLRCRPDLVVSTGAAPGCMAILAARLTGARAVWVDSYANVERVSLAGRLCAPLCHSFFVQWPALAGGRKVYRGALK